MLKRKHFYDLIYQIQMVLFRWAGAIILKISYGYNIKRDGKDPLISIINGVLHQFSVISKPGAWLVDAIPFRKLVLLIKGSFFEFSALFFFSLQFVIYRNGCLEPVLSKRLVNGVKNSKKLWRYLSIL